MTTRGARWFHRALSSIALIIGLLTCFLLGVHLDTSIKLRDVVCEGSLNADMAFQLADWSPMHELERGTVRDAISDEFQTLTCRSYVLGDVLVFPARQRWIKRRDTESGIKKIKR